MALAEDLLEQAKHLVNREPRRPRQASLRRAVSTAYYSVFHLLITAAISNWKGIEQRSALARGFEHQIMKQASKKTSRMPLRREHRVVGDRLKLIAATFVELQQARHAADYDYSARLDKTEVLKRIDTARAAFESWKLIRKEKLAQDYLVALLVRER
jgi:uncharacterized protein (UPF0332 family)